MTEPNPSQRILGGLYGSLVGDALGVPVEFQNRGMRQYDPVTSMRAFGTWNQPAGTWSDDGALLLCAVESLAEREFDTQDMGEGSVRWLQEGHWAARGRVFDIGHATHQALDRIAQGTPAEQAGGQGESSNGNGSLMRILPVPLATLTADLHTFCDQIERASAITHAHARSRLACVFHGLLVRHLMLRESPAAAHASAAREFNDRYTHHEELARFAPMLDPGLINQDESDIASTGYVLHTLHAALWCLLTTDTFKDCVLKAVNLGDDTDTTGCVAGGLAGLVYGVEAIPEEWLTVLPRQADLQNLFQKFINKNPIGKK
jgi:ADP-ribosylglycohydrolase